MCFVGKGLYSVINAVKSHLLQTTFKRRRYFWEDEKVLF